MNRMMTRAEVSEMLCVTIRTLDDWRSKGIGPPVYVLGNRRGVVRYFSNEVLEWIKQNEESPQR